jgi:hypothetical protein
MISRRKYQKCCVALNAIAARIAPPTKFKTGFQDVATPVITRESG